MEWDKLKKESEDNYALFLAYLDMFPRNIIQLAININLPTKQLKALSTQFNWDVRAKKFDEHERAIFFEHKKNIIESLAEDHVKNDFQIKSIAAEVAKEILVKILINEQSGNKTKISIPDLERIYNISKIISDNEKNTDENNIDYSKLSDEELSKLKELSEKSKA